MSEKICNDCVHYEEEGPSGGFWGTCKLTGESKEWEDKACTKHQKEKGE